MSVNNNNGPEIGDNDLESVEFESQQLLRDIEKELKERNISFGHVKGHSSSIEKLIMDYKTGNLQILLLNSNYQGSGHNLENTERVIDSNQSINIDWDSWVVPEIFKLIMSKGDVPFDDMARTFNLGIGMILIIDKNHIDDVDKYLKSIEEPYTVLGEVINK